MTAQKPRPPEGHGDSQYTGADHRNSPCGQAAGQTQPQHQQEQYQTGNIDERLGQGQPIEPDNLPSAHECAVQELRRQSQRHQPGGEQDVGTRWLGLTTLAGRKLTITAVRARVANPKHIAAATACRPTWSSEKPRPCDEERTGRSKPQVAHGEQQHVRQHDQRQRAFVCGTQAPCDDDAGGEVQHA